MSNSVEENKLTITTSSCHGEGGGCGEHKVSCCGMPDPAASNIYNDELEIKQRVYNERKLVKENEQIYKEFRKDFNPVLWGIVGLILGTIVGATVEQVLMIGADVTYTAAFGLFLGVSISINKNRANNKERRIN